MLESMNQALRHSSHCFFNSFIRDTQAEFNEESSSFVILIGELTLEIPVEKFSLVGVHQFRETYLLKGQRGQRQIGFLEAAELLCRTFGSTESKLFTRLNNSLSNMALSFEEREAEIKEVYSSDLDFLRSEQALLIGHNFHPTPKSRDEFSEQDLQSYAPEFGASFPLAWFFVKSELVFEERSEHFKNKWPGSQKSCPPGFVPFPVHPWQKRVLQSDPVIQRYLREGQILEGSESSERWSATSSLRSLYNPDSPFMLKFSMSVRLTNSLRHMQAREVGRGMVVQDAFQTSAGREFSARFPQFKLMHEPAFMAIRGLDQEILPQTVTLLRENPFHRNSPREVCVLATLTQDHPMGGKNLIANCLSQGVSAQHWFEAFLDCAVTPLLVAQGDYGILLGAHQQNLLLELRKGLPVGAYFRDCQGTGFSELGRDRLLADMPTPEKLQEHVLPTGVLIDLFTYYLVINSVLNTIAAVAKASDLEETIFIRAFRNRLQTIEPTVRDGSVIRHLLSSPTLKQKGNFRCSLTGLNENTTQDPLEIYNPMKNPFYTELPQ